MSEITIKKHIEAPIDTVFEAATDIPSWADRISGIQSVELLTDGPVGVGTKFRETRIMFGREATEEMEITGFDAPRSYTTEADSHGCHYVTKMTFEPSGSGTDVQMSFNAEPQTMFAKTMAAVMKPMIGKMRDMIGKDLDELKAAIEAKR
jgi:carbon monoxide dehydrogenase subunit G